MSNHESEPNMLSQEKGYPNSGGGFNGKSPESGLVWRHCTRIQPSSEICLFTR